MNECILITESGHAALIVREHALPPAPPTCPCGHTFSPTATRQQAHTPEYLSRCITNSKPRFDNQRTS